MNPQQRFLVTRIIIALLTLTILGLAIWGIVYIASRGDNSSQSIAEQCKQLVDCDNKGKFYLFDGLYIQIKNNSEKQSPQCYDLEPVKKERFLNYQTSEVVLEFNLKCANITLPIASIKHTEYSGNLTLINQVGHYTFKVESGGLGKETELGYVDKEKTQSTGLVLVYKK